MMEISKSIIAVLTMIVLYVGLSGCMKQEGPAERAGKKVDDTVEKGGQQLDKAGKKIEEEFKGK